MEILFIVLIISSLAVVVADSIFIYYKKEYNRLLEKQNEILLKNLSVDNKIFLALANNNNGGKEDE